MQLVAHSFFYPKELAAFVNKYHIKREQIEEITCNIDSSKNEREYTVFYWA